MNFVDLRKKTFVLSAVLVGLSIILLFVPGLNIGIDFTGGTIIEREVDSQVTAQSVRTVLDGMADLDLSGAVIQILDDSREFIIRTRTLESNQILAINSALDAQFGGLVERRTEVVGPVIGQELIRQALLALLIAAIGILAYVSVRFEYRYAVSAIIAALHDVLIVLGLFVITGREINSPFVAAILTVVGYSINDTIVIFDRIRENMGLRKKESREEVVNRSLNQTISRTINTSLTTFVVVLLLFIFGGTTISDFAFALLCGIVVGTYSSLFIASPIWLEWTLASRRKARAAAKS